MLRLLLVVAVLVSACTSPTEPPPPTFPPPEVSPPEGPLVRGPVESIEHRATASGMLVLAGPGSSEPCGIQATVTDTTVVERRQPDGSVVPARLGEIAVGDTVEVWVDGPVLESCPVQGGASRLVLVR